jgi:hypothetical protein
MIMPSALDIEKPENENPVEELKESEIEIEVK